MATAQQDYLLVQKGGHTYLFLKGPAHFHLVQADGMSEKRKERLLRLYPCGNQTLKEMKLAFSTFKAENLRYVTLSGCKAGNRIQLWVGSDLRVYTLAQDETMEKLNAFFDAQNKRWEVIRNDCELEQTQRKQIALWVNVVSIACAVLFFLVRRPYKLWSTLCILCFVATIVLTVAYPGSFTMVESKKIRYSRGREAPASLLGACMAPLFALTLRELSDFTFAEGGFGTTAIIALMIGAAIGVLLWLKAPRMREDMVEFIALLIMLTFLQLGTVAHLNHLLDFNPPREQMLEVVDKHCASGPKATSYYCTVVFPNGEKEDLTVSGGIYRQVEVGEDILVATHGGAFGIEYSMVELPNP
ncbi:MAG: hypothetical protein IJ422_03140 [Oscillospiraceae bacterium]|nr:hypothetical protein [Oscillospiraceae bacterium]MBQ9149123.1 hypothetical protein [Oscillospiraceae bacterium]